MRRPDSMQGGRFTTVAMILALALAGSSCDGSQNSQPSTPTRRPITEEEFFEYVVGHTIFRSDSGAHMGIGGEPPVISGFDGCNQYGGPLIFSNGEVLFPEEGLQSTELACPGIKTDGAPWIFGAWMVDPDGSLVVIATDDGSEHHVPGITIPTT